MENKIRAAKAVKLRNLHLLKSYECEAAQKRGG